MSNGTSAIGGTKYLFIILGIALLSLALPKAVSAATEFISVVDPGNGSGTDYTSLSAWENSFGTIDLTSNTLVFSGTTTGTLSDSVTVYQCQSGVYQNVTGTMTHDTAGQALVKGITAGATFQTNDRWYTNSACNSASYSTISNAGDSPIAVAKCRTTTGAADTTAVRIDGWTTSAANYIKVWTDPSENYRHQGKWDASKYNLTVSTINYLISIAEEYVTIDGLQVKHNIANSNNLATIRASASGTGLINISNNVVVGVLSGTAASNMGIAAVGNVNLVSKIWNNIIFDYINGTNTEDAIYVSQGTNYIYNNTVVDSYSGIYINSGTGIAKNNIVKGSGNTKAYGGTFATGTDYNTTDGTDAIGQGLNNRVSQTFTFANEANDDFHLSSSDSGARNSGTDLSNDAYLPFSTDIDGQTRSANSAWDIGADETAIQVFYSVGQNTSDHKTGTPTVDISSGVATFSAAQTATNMGVGDKVTYNTNVVAYISQKISDVKWKLITATGGTPADISGSTVVSIAHAYASLYNAESGIPTALGTSDLVTGNYQLNIPCYYDTGPDQTDGTVDGWTTGANNYIKIYTPYDTVSEVNQSQRHSGKWDTNKYYLETNFSTTDNSAIRANEDYVRIEGLQVRTICSGVISGYMVGIYVAATSGIGNSDIRISNSIIRHSVTSGSVAYNNGIYSEHGTVKIWNVIVYDVQGTSKGRGIGAATDSIIYAYNCTAVDNTNNYDNDSSVPFVVKNSIGKIYGGESFGDYYDAASNYNSTDGWTVPGESSRREQTFTFADEANDDFRLSLSDTGAKDAGTNLLDSGSEAGMTLEKDISGHLRPGAGMSGWDIGASEAGQTVLNSGEQQALSNTDGLVLYQSFDGPDINGTTSIDRSGQGNDGTITGATPVMGKRGQALGFDGTGDYAEINNPGSLFDGQNITGSAWIYPHSFPNSWPRIIDRVYNGQFSFYLGATGVMTAGLNTVGTDIDSSLIGCTVPTNIWSHVVYAYDGENLFGYINGTQCGMLSTPSGALTTSSSAIRIGERVDIGGGSRAFDGQIDEVRIYNRALSADEIGNLYRLGEVKVNSSQATNANNGLILSQSFDGKDVFGTAAYDRSGLGNNGTISGATPTMGKRGQAMSFDGVDDYVNAGSASNLDNLSAMTISVWAKANGYGENGQGYFIDKLFGGNGWHFQKLITASKVRFFVTYDGSPDLVVHSADNTLTSSDFGKWIHWTVTWDGSASYLGVHIYKDGTEVAYSTRSDGVGNRNIDANGSLMIGNNSVEDLDRSFYGSLDEVRLYNRALSADEVKDLYNMGQVIIRK